MSTGIEATPPESDGLQFDRAEFAEGAGPAAVVSCAACQRPIAEAYYEINGTVFCEPCRVGIEANLRGGSGLARWLRAAAYGTGAAVLGTIAYVAFRRLSPNWDIAFVAIFVGFLVGKAVRKGSRGLGGLAYQILAMLLTYTSLAMTYCPELEVRSQTFLTRSRIRSALAVQTNGLGFSL